MRAILLILSLLLPVPALAQTATPTATATEPAPAVISYPLPGQALQGDILITGTTRAEGFAAYEISFGYDPDPTGTWFKIEVSTQPVDNGVLAHWDTTTITDGDYALRMLTTLTDGSQIILYVPGLRVRNYSAIETDTPTPVPPTDTPPPGTPLPPSTTPTSTPIPSATPIPPTPTPLPTNPAIISQADVLSTIGTGAGIGVGLLVVTGAIIGGRQWLRRRK
jgi:hypothetical protein